MESQQGSSKMNIKGIWKRMATPRELFYGVRTDGTLLSPCTAIEINCRQEITPKQFHRCVQHFNKNVPCFHEYITEGKNEEFWLALQLKSTYTIEQIFEPNRSNSDIMEELINFHRTAENVASWEFYYIYKGKNEDRPNFRLASKYPHLYQFIFLFNTGTIDDYSCALVCDLFLNTLDCILKDIQMPTYLGIRLYDIGYIIKDIMSSEKRKMRISGVNVNEFLKVGNIFEGSIGNYCFSLLQEDESPAHKTHTVSLSEYSTRDFFQYCEEMELSVYTSIVTLFNCIILRNARESGFDKPKLVIKVLHHINTKFLNSMLDDKYIHQVGSHMIPYMNYMTVDSIDFETLSDEAKLLEDVLIKCVQKPSAYTQEVCREIVIDSSKSNYKTGSWNSNYFYSMSNLGDLDLTFNESELNSFYTSGYDRSKASQETGCMDITFYVFRKRLHLSVDYSTRDISEMEIKDIFNLFAAAVDFI